MRFLMVILILFLTGISHAQDRSFEYEKFKEVDGFILSSDAKLAKKGRLRLTPKQQNRRGGIWFKKKMWVSDSFDMSFCFKIHDHGGRDVSGTGGEGFAFVIHNNELTAKNGEKGKGLGYEGIPNSLAIEFDTQNQDGLGVQHVSIQTRGTEENSSGKDASIASSVSLPFRLVDEEDHTARISYSAPNLSVYLDGQLVLETEVEISSEINLDGGAAWVGITSATGKAYSIHELSCWSMTSTKKPIPFEVEGRVVSNSKRVVVHSKVVKIYVWDINQEDGDIVSVNLNGEWVIRDFMLSNAGDYFEVELKDNLNYLVLHAHNLGSIPPNTAGVAILDDKGRKAVTMRSNMNVSEALLIEYHKE